MDNGIPSSEFQQLIKSLDGLTTHVAAQNRMVTDRYLGDLGNYEPHQRRQMQVALGRFLKDARVVSSMSSQALEHDNLTSTQSISLKASLARLESEIRLLELKLVELI